MSTKFIEFGLDESGLDHGLLLGLSDDDHTIYILVDGTRAFTGDQTFNENIILKAGKKIIFDG